MVCWIYYLEGYRGDIIVTDKMKIIFWNTYMRSKPEEVWQAMQSIESAHSEIDIWCFSEVNPDLQKLLKKERMHLFYCERSDENTYRASTEHGIMVASRKPIKKPRSYMLSELKKRKGIHKTPVILCEAKTSKGNITIATSHLTFWGAATNNARRKKERRKLLEYLPRNKAIFGGDLNSVILKPVVWGLKDAGFQQLHKGMTWRWHPLRKLAVPFFLQLDHVFATPDLIASCKVEALDSQPVSDHRPLLVNIS